MNKAFLWYRLACFIIACNHKVEFDLIIRSHPISVRADIDLQKIYFCLQNRSVLSWFCSSVFLVRVLFMKQEIATGVLFHYLRWPIEYNCLPGLRFAIKSIPLLFPPWTNLETWGKGKQDDDNHKQTKLSGWVLQQFCTYTERYCCAEIIWIVKWQCRHYWWNYLLSLILAPLINEQMAYKVSQA